MAHTQILKDAKLFWSRFIENEQMLYKMMLSGGSIDDVVKGMLPESYHSKIIVMVADTPGMLYNKLRNSSNYHIILSTGNRESSILYVEYFYQAYRSVILQHFYVTKYMIGSTDAIDEKTEYNGIRVDGLRYNISKVDGRYDIMVFVDEYNLQFTSEDKEFAYVQPSDELLIAMYWIIGEYNLLKRIGKIQFYPAILYPDIVRKTITELREQINECRICSFCKTPSYCCDFIHAEYCSSPCRMTANPSLSSSLSSSSSSSLSGKSKFKLPL